MTPARRLPADPFGRAACRSGRKTGVRADCPSRKTDTGCPTARHIVRRTSSRRDCRRYTEGTSCRASTERRNWRLRLSSLVPFRLSGQHLVNTGMPPNSRKKVNAKPRPCDTLLTAITAQRSIYQLLALSLTNQNLLAFLTVAVGNCHELPNA